MKSSFQPLRNMMNVFPESETDCYGMLEIHKPLETDSASPKLSSPLTRMSRAQQLTLEELCVILNISGAGKVIPDIADVSRRSLETVNSVRNSQVKFTSFPCSGRSITLSES